MQSSDARGGGTSDIAAANARKVREELVVDSGMDAAAKEAEMLSAK